MRVEQEQKVTEDARIFSEQEAAAQKYAAYLLQVLFGLWPRNHSSVIYSIICLCRLKVYLALELCNATYSTRRLLNLDRRNPMYVLNIPHRTLPNNFKKKHWFLLMTYSVFLCF